MNARGLVPGPADLAGVVRGEERAHHELATPDIADLAADLFDDAGVLVAHRGRTGQIVDSAPWPHVRSADAGGAQPDDRVRRLDDSWIFSVLDPDVARAVHDYSTHGLLLSGG